MGGSTSLAVVGAYVLAGELQRAVGDPARAFPAYEQAMAEPVLRSREFARHAARTLVPSSRIGVNAFVRGTQLVSLLPTAVTKALTRLGPGSIRIHDSMQVPEYPPTTS